MEVFLDTVFEWIRAHPAWAGVLIFLTAFTESLAIVGILVPGALILFGLGALVAFDVLDLGTTWFWCSVGAVLGDGLSFWLGHHYRDRLRGIWPFSRYKEMMRSGERFFQKHGGLSIFVGRFVGPVRPIIPVTAGMLGMPIKRYVPVNIVASILWSPAYILPGVAFGASIELAAAVGTRLALILGLVVALVFLLWWSITRSYRLFAPRAEGWLRGLHLWSQRHPLVGRYADALVDPKKRESTALVFLGVCLVLAVLLTVAFLIFAELMGGVTQINHRVWVFFSNLRHPWIDIWMAVPLAIGASWVSVSAATLSALYLTWRKRWHAVQHWLLTLLPIVVVMPLLNLLFGFTPPPDSPLQFAGPSTNLALLTATLGFFAILCAAELPRRRRIWPYILAGVLSGLAALAEMYFSRQWLGSVLAGIALGAVWTGIVGIAYRRRERRAFWGKPMEITFFTTLLLAASLQLWVKPRLNPITPPAPEPVAALEYVTTIAAADAPGPNQLPFNLVLVGALPKLNAAMTEQGWERVTIPAWEMALKSIQPSPKPEAAPLLPRSWHGQPQSARWLYYDDQETWAIRIWKTQYRLNQQVVFFGQVYPEEIKSRWYFFTALTDVNRDIESAPLPPPCLLDTIWHCTFSPARDGLPE